MTQHPETTTSSERFRQLIDKIDRHEAAEAAEAAPSSEGDAQPEAPRTYLPTSEKQVVSVSTKARM